MKAYTEGNELPWEFATFSQSKGKKRASERKQGENKGKEGLAPGKKPVVARGEKVLLVAKKANADRLVCLVELSPFLDPLLALFTFSFAERVGEGRRGELIFSGGLSIPFYYTLCVSLFVLGNPIIAVLSWVSTLPHKRSVGRFYFLHIFLWERKDGFFSF